ncbi:MAG: hlyA 3 [Phycisphaerales bacterium]|nr:hlyA 3 [Phycisphaerales bacterium]
MKNRRHLNVVSQAVQVWNLEQLESRRLMSATLIDGVLTLKGTQSDDSIYVYRSYASNYDYSWKLYVDFSIQNVMILDVSQVREIHVDAGDGNDRVEIGLDWAPLDIPATINGGAGNDSIYGSNANDVIFGGSGADRIGGTEESSHFGGDVPDGASVVGQDTLIPGVGNDVLDGRADSTQFKGEGRRRAYMSEIFNGVMTVDASGLEDKLSLQVEAEGNQRYLMITDWWGGPYEWRSGTGGGGIPMEQSTLREIRIYRNGGTVAIDMDAAFAALGIKVTLMDPPARPARVDKTQPKPATIQQTAGPNTADQTSEAVYLSAPSLNVPVTTFSVNPLLISDDQLWDA